jgi:hypothetical protein
MLASRAPKMEMRSLRKEDVAVPSNLGWTFEDTCWIWQSHQTQLFVQRVDRSHIAVQAHQLSSAALEPPKPYKIHPPRFT